MYEFASFHADLHNHLLMWKYSPLGIIGELII